MSWRLRDQPPGRRRLLRLLAAYGVVMLALVLLDLSPSPVLVGAFLVAGTSVAVFAGDRFADSQSEPWPVAGQSTVGLGRGSDHRTVALARRLAVRERDPGPSRHLATELHQQLRAVLADRVRRERGWDVLADPELAYEALPAELADIVARAPDLRLADPRYLATVLDRVETS